MGKEKDARGNGRWTLGVSACSQATVSASRNALQPSLHFRTAIHSQPPFSAESFHLRAISKLLENIYIYIYTYLSICYIARGALPRKNRDKVVYALKLCPSRSNLGKATLSEYSREAEWIDETRTAVEAGKHIFNQTNTYFLKFRQSERGITTILQ